MLLLATQDARRQILYLLREIMKKKEKEKKKSAFVVYGTEKERNFLEEIKKEEGVERKIERMDEFFKTKSSYFVDSIFVNINNYIEENWIIEIKLNQKGKGFFMLKHKNTRGDTGSFHLDKTFSTLEDCYLYISNHNKKYIKKKNPVRNTKKELEEKRIKSLFNKARSSRGFTEERKAR